MATRLSKEARAARMAKALQLVDEGVDRGCIAERLGVKRGTVNDWVRNRTKEAAGGNDGDA